MNYSKSETKLKKENNKFSPLGLLGCRLWPQMDFHSSRASHRCGNLKLWHLLKVRGSSPMHSIPSYLRPFSLLSWHPNPLSLNPPQYQSIFSMTYPMNNYQHTLLHRLSWQSYPSPHGQTIRETFIKTLLHFTQLLYPCIWDSILWGCSSVHP